MALIDETTQASLRLMDQIRNSRLFTMATSGGIMKLTQRHTNLCVSVAAMRLLCYALDEFLVKNTKWKQSSKLSLRIDLLEHDIITMRILEINTPEAFSNQILTRRTGTQTDFYFTGLLPYALPPVPDFEPYRQNRGQNIAIEENNSEASFSSWDEDRILEEEEINEEILNDLL